MDPESRLNIRINDLENLSKCYNFTFPFLQKARKRNMLIIPKFYVPPYPFSMFSLKQLLYDVVFVGIYECVD